MHYHKLIKRKGWTLFAFGLTDEIYQCTICKREFDLSNAEVSTAASTDDKPSKA